MKGNTNGIKNLKNQVWLRLSGSPMKTINKDIQRGFLKEFSIRSLPITALYTGVIS